MAIFMIEHCDYIPAFFWSHQIKKLKTAQHFVYRQNTQFLVNWLKVELAYKQRQVQEEPMISSDSIACLCKEYKYQQTHCLEIIRLSSLKWPYFIEKLI